VPAQSSELRELWAGSAAGAESVAAVALAEEAGADSSPVQAARAEASEANAKVVNRFM
jgi:hypothetical protein